LILITRHPIILNLYLKRVVSHGRIQICFFQGHSIIFVCLRWNDICTIDCLLIIIKTNYNYLTYFYVHKSKLKSSWSYLRNLNVIFLSSSLYLMSLKSSGYFTLIPTKAGPFSLLLFLVYSMFVISSVGPIHSTKNYLSAPGFI
jgi:hypothetical protein